MSDWNGSLDKLGKLMTNLSKLASVPSRASGSVAAEIARLIDQQFASGTDPNGRPWAKLMPSTVKRKRGNTRILVRTGDMRKGVRVTPMSGGGVSITLAGYGGFHQSGTKNMVIRMILPGATFPKTWRIAIEKSVRDAYGKALK